MSSRLETLKWLYEEAKDALEKVPATNKSALISQLRAISREIEEIGDDSIQAEVVETNGLIDFQKRLAERQSTSSPTHSAARRQNIRGSS